jgi:hypothetical protein
MFSRAGVGSLRFIRHVSRLHPGGECEIFSPRFAPAPGRRVRDFFSTFRACTGEENVMFILRVSRLVWKRVCACHSAFFMSFLRRVFQVVLTLAVVVWFAALAFCASPVNKLTAVCQLFLSLLDLGVYLGVLLLCSAVIWCIFELMGWCLSGCMQ